jgi:3-oxoacyl-[acyl-carrier protein] reductase
MIEAGQVADLGIQKYAGKVAIITGAGTGLGAAIAMRLSALGATVVLNDLSPIEVYGLEETIRSYGNQAIAVVGDISVQRDVNQLVQVAEGLSGAVDILVNNAGILKRTKVEEITEDEWDQVIDVNLKGPFLTSRAVISQMKIRRSGKLVNVASMAGRATSTLGGAHYSASKAGLLGLTRHLAREFAPYNINVNAVCPGIVNTNMVRQSLDTEEERELLSHIPFGRFADPQEIALLVEFLVSDGASYITGASVDIHGGEIIIQ